MKPQRGFTLIELLIAVLILSMVVFVGSLSFSTFSSRWSKDDTRFEAALGEFQKLLLLGRLFEGVSNYIVRQQDNNNYYFTGDNQQMRFISEAAIFNPGALVHITLNIEVTPEGESRLVYYEAPLQAHTAYQFNQTPAPMHKLVLLQAENIRFNYLGWKDNKTRLLGSDIDYDYQPEWSPEFSAQRSGIMPEQISIIWDNSEPVLFRIKTDNGSKFSYQKEVWEDA